MPSSEKTVHAYEELADWYERQGLDQLRDRFLVLAADAALSIGSAEEAERLRARLLERNPHHLLKPFASLAEALKTPDVQNYVSGLRRGYPPESVDSLLEALRSGKSAPAPVGRATPAATPKPTAPRPEASAEDDVGTLRMGAGEVAPLSAKPVQPPAVYAVKEDKLPPTPDAPRPRQVPPPGGSARPAPPAPPRPIAKPTLDPARPHPPAVKAPAGNPPRPVEPTTYPLRPEPGATPRGRAPERDEPEEYAGAWLPSVLFVLLLLVGVALAVYTFAGPFLPAAWLRW
jgi:hypothetical protein